MTALLDRGLPANLDAERFVLGSILLNDARYPDVAAALEVNDFSLEKHRRIYSRMKDLYARGEDIDRVTVANELNRHGQLKSVDGASYLVSLDEGIPEIANLESYVRIVKEKALLRENMFACQGVIKQCALAAEPSTAILETATAILESVRNKGDAKPTQWVTPREILERGVDSVLFPARGSAGMKTPWVRLTEMTSGWHPGELVTVGGRPGMGKERRRHAAGLRDGFPGNRRRVRQSGNVQGVVGATFGGRYTTSDRDAIHGLIAPWTFCQRNSTGGIFKA